MRFLHTGDHDGEGKDYLTAVEPFRQPCHIKQFSRILQWPEGLSGVTLGRGYDMKTRSAGKILTQIRHAGIEEYKAVICSKASHLMHNEARNFVRTYGPLIGEITHLQQIRLFEISYAEKRDYAKHFYQKYHTHHPNTPVWEDIDQKIRDVVVDIFYQGVHDVNKLFNAAVGGRQSLVDLIRADAVYMNYEPNRHRIKYLQ